MVGNWQGTGSKHRTKRWNRSNEVKIASLRIDVLLLSILNHAFSPTPSPIGAILPVLCMPICGRSLLSASDKKAFWKAPEACSIWWGSPAYCHGRDFRGDRQGSQYFSPYLAFTQPVLRNCLYDKDIISGEQNIVWLLNSVKRFPLHGACCFPSRPVCGYGLESLHIQQQWSLFLGRTGGADGGCPFRSKSDLIEL